MRFVIMADGKERRWKKHLGTSKHLAEIGGEPLIVRTIRLVRQQTPKDTEVIVTSHNKDYEFEGSLRYEPENNMYEIDRFTEELLTNNMCFLYGDTYYTEAAMKKIISADNEKTLFFGNRKSIVAVKIADAGEFRHHKERVKQMYIDEQIDTCKGWQVYQSFTGQDLTAAPVIKENFVLLEDDTTDINTPEDYDRLV